MPTASLAHGYVQANLVIVDRSLADDFEQFCLLNPRPLPLIERLAMGSPRTVSCAQNADVRTDLPRYRIYEDGVIQREPTNLLDIWQDDWCAFLLGCSFTFDAILADKGIPVRHLEQGCNVPMYKTNRPLKSSGPFAGNLVVSMRPMPATCIDQVIELTRPLELAHGEPVQIGVAEALGILNLDLPDYGDAVEIRSDEVPVFWACGVTAQHVAQTSRIPLTVTHAPGHMFVTDLRIDDRENEDL